MATLNPLRGKDYLNSIVKDGVYSTSYAEHPMSTPHGITMRDRGDATRCDLQLAYFHPSVAGVLVPAFVLVGAALMPFVDRGNVLAFRPSERKTAVVLFSLFCALGLFVTFVGIFFRGPGYAFVIPSLEFFSIGTPGFHFAL